MKENIEEEIVDILLVEDRAEDAELCIMSLRENNLVNNIKWVKDGQEALDFLFIKNKYANRNGHIKPRLVLLDLKMPKVDGIEVLRQIRADKALKNLVVVILTTSKEDGDIKRAYDLGVNSYILK